MIAVKWVEMEFEMASFPLNSKLFREFFCRFQPEKMTNYFSFLSLKVVQVYIGKSR